jgi:hypothetical protein
MQVASKIYNYLFGNTKDVVVHSWDELAKLLGGYPLIVNPNNSLWTWKIKRWDNENEGVIYYPWNDEMTGSLTTKTVKFKVRKGTRSRRSSNEKPKDLSGLWLYKYELEKLVIKWQE